MSDHVFLGRVNPYLIIQDVGITIPWGVEVSVPRETANLSRDLWVAVSEKKILQLATPDTHKSPVPTATPLQSPKPGVSVSGETLIQEIRQTNSLLMELISSQRETAALLREFLSRPAPVVYGAPATTTVTSHGVDNDLPVFIPDVVAPTLAHKVDVPETSQESNVSKMGAALRARRQNSSLSLGSLWTRLLSLLLFVLLRLFVERT